MPHLLQTPRPEDPLAAVVPAAGASPCFWDFTGPPCLSRWGLEGRDGVAGLVCPDWGVSCIPPPLSLLVVGSAQIGCSDDGVDYLLGGWAWEGESVA